MQKRTLLAVATLTALVLSVGTLQPAAVGAAPEPAPDAQALALGAATAAEQAVAPQWGAAFGFKRFGAFVWGVVSAGVCAPFTGPGAAACAVAGAA